MKMLKKLALVSAISAISAGAFAMEAMDDESMAATTGQDGITINIVPDAISYSKAAGMGVTDKTMSSIADLDGVASTVDPAPLYKGLSIGEIRVHDNDGWTVAGGGTADTANSGALVIGGSALAEDLDNDGNTTDAGESAAERTKANRTVLLSKGDKPIQINIDMVGDSNGATADGGPMLNVEIKQPALAIKLGNIYVADSYNTGVDGVDDSAASAASAVLVNDDVDNAGATDGNAVRGKVKILDGLEIVMAASTMKIQLGNESQGSMIVANAVLTGGLTLNKFALYDESGAAALTADNLIAGDVGSGGSFRASSIKITNNGGNDLTANTSIDFGSRITASTVTVGGAAETAFKNAQAVKAGYADYASAPAPVQTALDGAATHAGSLANTAAATAGTWGGVDTYNGLVITSELGGATGADITIANAVVGDINASIIGDVQIIGLMLGKSKIVVMGH